MRAVVMLTGLLLAGVTGAQTPAAAPAAATALPPAMAPAAEIAPRVLLIPQRETTVVSQTVGRIDRLGGELGGSFNQGGELVAFECSEAMARLNMAVAELDSARENHDAKLRLQKLEAAGEVEVSMAAAAVNKARAQTELNKAQVKQCKVEAPFTGRIVKLHVKPFQVVNIGQPLIDIVSAGALKVKLNVPSRWLVWLRPGARFDVKIDETGRTYPAVVAAINARVDAVSQSIELEGRINGTFPELLAGMSGNAQFVRAGAAARK